MKKAIFFPVLVLPFMVCAQVNLKKLAQKSAQAFAYRVTAETAEKYIKQDSIDADAYLTQAPGMVFNSDSIDETKLPAGLYVIIRVSDYEVLASLTSVTNLVVYPINNRHRLQLLVRDKQGNFINNAHVWVNGKQAVYNALAESYYVSQKKPDGALVKIYTPGDTTYITLTSDNDWTGKAVWRQRLNNLARTKFIRLATWPPRNIAWLFKQKRHRQPVTTIGAAGTMVFNQPKYKQRDTVKLKAYVFNKNWRRYDKPAYVWLKYFSTGVQRKQFIAVAKPSSPGSYIMQFPLADTLANDISYTVELDTKEGRRIIAKAFKMEDYVLDEVAKYNLRSAQETYYSNDTMRFYASATDANGLPLLDGRARLALTAENINLFYEDSMYVPDTLFTAEKKLLTQGETEFAVPANILPDARVAIKAVLTFVNSNNELQYRAMQVQYSPGHKELVAEIKADTVFAEYRINGKSTAAEGLLKISGGIELAKQVVFPVKMKVDPLAEEYDFFTAGGNGMQDSATARVTRRGAVVTLSRISKGDTLGFVLNNPFKIPVSFTVFNGNTVTATGTGSDAAITWQMTNVRPKKMYTVKWQYWWAAHEEYGQQTIGLLYKLLTININNAQSVFPGQKDSLLVSVTDYRNRPAENVNLTAFSYNSQFKNDIRVPDPPYLARYKLKPLLLRDKFEIDDASFYSHYPLGKHIGWLKRMGLDSMLYYQMLFPAHGYVDKAMPVSGFLAQVGVNAVSHGQKQQIYMLYINRQLVYYYGVTEKMPYAFATYGGYTQIGMRLYNKFITIDSIYLQPNYKHDLVFDINNLPPASKVDTVANYLSQDETSLLENSLWQLDNNFETNYGYVWQNSTLVHIAGAFPHIVGPFALGDSMHFFAPGGFDNHFKFEPGYEYDMSKQILRLEKKQIFPLSKDKYYLPIIDKPVWILGDTIVPPPVIEYPPKINKEQYFLSITPYHIWPGSGKLKFTIAKGISLRYVILYSADSAASNQILGGSTHEVYDINSGLYTVLLVDQQNNTAQINNVNIKAGYTFCINATGYKYSGGNDILYRLFYEAAELRQNPAKPVDKTTKQTNNNTWQKAPAYGSGGTAISGKIIDAKGGLPVAFATIVIQGTKTGTSAAADGSFVIKGIKEGRCTIVISAIGYETKELVVEAFGTETKLPEIKLYPSTQSLHEVVVTGYSAVQKKELTGAVSIVQGEELSSAARGLLATKNLGMAVDIDGNVTARGEKIFNINFKSDTTEYRASLYVIDGIAYQEMPANITPDMINDVSVLNGSEAIALYGAGAYGGAMVITTKTKTARSQFRDYAFWQPQLFTDKNGQVKFEVTYPDNTTGWQTYVLGMDKHSRMGKAVSFVQSYKPVMAQLSMPQFLVEGDSALPVGKALNYTGDVYNATTSFMLNGVKTAQDAITLQPKASLVKQYGIIAPVGDTVTAAFGLQTSTGFKDGEERKIPVFKQGTEEATGNFWVLKNDTAFSFTPKITGQPVELYAQNNTLDILLDEIGHLKTYPYYCMEQTSSKLRGLLMEKKIDETLQKPFTGEKTIDWLVQKLQKAQLYSGGWPWWQDGNADINITSYVVKALLPLRDNPLIETNIRNGLLYLQNELTNMDRGELLAALSTMCEAHHLFDYAPWLQKINFDSLSVHQQWQLVKIKQLLGEEHATELKYLLSKAVPGMLGSLHWGEDNYHWYGDANATTTLAFEVLRQEKGHDDELNEMLQYFLGQRKQGYWVNTVTSASVVSATLPYLLARDSGFQKPASVNVSGDSVFAITQFPYKAIISAAASKQLTIHKTGGAFVYLTAYQRFFNAQPQPATDNFFINTSFEKNGTKVAHLTAGEKITMVVTVDALKEAEYVMMEIPIPAGCIYADKKQDDWNVHKEFVKNKAILFTEHLSRGMHTFTLDLECRYGGNYTLNPAKASLMYYPTFFGRNEMKRVEVR